MALRGNLKDFSLPDVFQLITFSQKTGVLRINREDGAFGSVWFRDGEVFFASSNWHKEPLGERLVKAQRITPQALSRALELRSAEDTEGRRLGQILVDEGYITESVLEDFVSEQIQDTIFDLMRWDEGEFDFEAMPEVVDEDIGLSVSIENVVMEGARRLEEWNRIKKKIPSMDVVFKMATAPGEGTFEISLKPTEWQLLLLTDGTRSVADLAHETERTDFDVARIVYGLFSAGLLEFASDEEIAHNRAERAEREERVARLAAERKTAEEEQRRAAEARQAKQAEEQERRRLEREAAETKAEPVSEEPVPRTSEVPEFLGGAAAAPASDDQSVLEQAMGAVLDHRRELEAPPTTPEPEPAQPHVPAEEPAFISAGPAEEPEQAMIPVPSVEDLLGIPAVTEGAGGQPEPEQVAPEPEPVYAPEPVSEPVSEPVPVPEPEPEPVEIDPGQYAEPQAEAGGPPALDIDFERDLMALGLGELPSDLLQPMEPKAVAPQEPAEDTLEAVAEPMSEIDLGLGFGVEELSSLVEDLEQVEGEPPAPAEIEPAPSEPDFSELLQSLDVDAASEDLGPPPVQVVESDFDTELLEDVEAGSAAAGGVISTDAYIEDISIDSLSFTGGLTDELSALTGADRRPAGRPQANVHAIPDEDSPVLKRDARVDADTLRKIIDGIKNL